MAIEFRKDLFKIFEAITPQQIQDNQLIKDCMEVFCDVVDEIAPSSVNIHSVFDEPEFRKEFLNTYNGTLMRSLQDMKKDSRYIAERDAFFEEYGVLPINEDLLDTPELILKQEDMNVFRSFYEQKGLFKGINFVHSWLLEHLNIEDKKELRIVERNPFEISITGKVPEVIYNYLIRSIAHPLGFVYAYFEGSMTNPNSDYYWNVVSEYVFSYFNMTYLNNNSVEHVDLTYEIKGIQNGVIEYAWYKWDIVNDDWEYDNGLLIPVSENSPNSRRKKVLFYDISTAEFDNTHLQPGTHPENGYVGTKTTYKIKVGNNENASIEVIRNQDDKYNLVVFRNKNGTSFIVLNNPNMYLETENSYFLKIGDTTVIDYNFYVTEVVHMSEVSNDSQLQFDFHGIEVSPLQKYNNTVNDYNTFENPFEAADAPPLAYHDVNREFENYDKVFQNNDYTSEEINKRKQNLLDLTDDQSLVDAIQIGHLGWFSSLSRDFINEKYSRETNENISFTPQPITLKDTYNAWYKEDKQFKFIGQRKYLSTEPLKIGDTVNGKPTKIGRGVLGYQNMRGFRFVPASEGSYYNNTTVTQENRWQPIEAGGVANFYGDSGLKFDGGVKFGQGVSENFDEKVAFKMLNDSFLDGTNAAVVDSGIPHYNFPRMRGLKVGDSEYTFYKALSPRQQQYNKLHFKAKTNHDAEVVNLQFYCTEYFSIQSIS